MAGKKRKVSSSPEPANKAVKNEPVEDKISPDVARWTPEAGLPAEANWPAPADEMTAATQFLLRLLPKATSIKSEVKLEDGDHIDLSPERPLLIIPDKDADGLSSGQILHRTLLHLGVAEDCIKVHHLTKGTNPASHSETDSYKSYNPAAVVMLDQGSRPGPPLLGPGDQTPVLVIDHHFLKPGEKGPEGSLMINASHSLPVATSSLLTWCLCRPLWKDPVEAEAAIDWLAVLGTAGDLSVNVPWDAPWPDLAPELKKWTKKRIGTIIALLNAPRRTPEFQVSIAYSSLHAAKDPLQVLDPALNKHASELYRLREAVSKETERCTHTPPKFAKDGRLAVLFISSPYQIHPGIATRWSGALRGAKNLQVVMSANDAYSPHKTHTHFSCRRAGAAMKRGENPNIIEILHSYAARDPTFLSDVVKREKELELEGKGELKTEESDDCEVAPDTGGSVEALNFARGHREASGGILPHELFKRFVELMEIGVPPEKKPGDSPGKKKGAPEQKTKLTSFFTAKAG